MELGLPHLTLLALAAAVASAINAVAGGGTLISFPALLAVGLHPLDANISNNLALFPGTAAAAWSERAALRGQGARLPWAVLPAILGGAAGAWLVLATGAAAFEKLVPWLILVATLLVASGPRLKAWAHSRLAGDSRESRPGLAAASALGSLYAGYFGAGQGLVYLALMAFALPDALPRINALRQALTLAAKAAAVVYFVVGGHVVWTATIAMALGSTLGGAVAGPYAARISPTLLRAAVTVIGLVVAGVYFIHPLGA